VSPSTALHFTTYLLGKHLIAFFWIANHRKCRMSNELLQMLKDRKCGWTAAEISGSTAASFMKSAADAFWSVTSFEHQLFGSHNSSKPPVALKRLFGFSADATPGR
jgi:hypothetical protein